MRLLYHAASSHGGLADYAHEQASALARAGVEVDVLCAPDFARGKQAPYARRTELPESSGRSSSNLKLKRAKEMFELTTGSFRALARTTAEGNFSHVLLGSYAEYFAPFWAPRLRALAKKGVTFGAIVHDPIRDTVLGPRWWHRRSVAAGYSFLRHAFVHEELALDTCGAQPGPQVTVIPHGPYDFITSEIPRTEARARFNLPAEAPVLLSFGHIRDNKNLDLAIHALAHFPQLHLLVAGREMSASDKPVAHYQRLAESLGIANRCHWENRFIPAEEVGAFFSAADFMLLTYAASFRSASGVLSSSIRFRKPCLASSGPGPLRSAVERYQLGVFVEPGNADALAHGLGQLLDAPPAAAWERYLAENSWEINAQRVKERLLAA